MREFELLEHIYAANPALGGHVVIPPGDDMAMLRLGGRLLLAAVDQLVDGRHVRLETTPLDLVGRKAVARSVSDVAAMAARPVATLAAVTLPPDFGQERAVQLFDAMRAAADEFDCPLVGGDFAVHAAPAQPLVCSITVLAEPEAPGPVRRGGAQVGDIVYVTGRLGGSYEPGGGGRHLTFHPRIHEALELLRALGPRLHSMIDISDGLGRDAAHIAAMSNVQFVLEADRVPCMPGIPWQRALSDGEDYELCFTAIGPVPETLGSLKVTAVGEAIAHAETSAARVVVRDGSTLVPADHLGWQHQS